MIDRIVAVVVHFADPTVTERCVRSLLAAGLPVVVVDNAGTYDRSRPATELVRAAENLGYGGGANVGLRRAFESAPLALLVNDDVTLEHPDGIERLAAALERDSNVGIAGPFVEGPDGKPQPTVEEWPSLARALRLAVRSYSRPLPGTVAEVEAVNGACMLISKDAFEATGGFDERYFLYAEEIDLCYRAAAAGYKTVFVPVRTIVHHHVAGEVRGDAASRIRINYVRFCRDHRGLFTALAVALLFLGSAVLRRRRPRELARGIAPLLAPDVGAFADRWLVPALVAAWIVLLALGSSWIGSIRAVGRAGKFAIPVVLIALELPRIVASPRRYLAGLRPGPLDGAIVALLAFATLSAAWSMLPRRTLEYVAGTTVFFGSILLGPRRIAQTSRGVSGLLTGILAGTALVLVANLIAYAYSPSGAVIRPPGVGRRLRGLLESPDEIGCYAVVTPLILWWALVAVRNGKRRTAAARASIALAAPLALLLLIELALSGSRSGLALFGAAIFVFLAAYVGGRVGAAAAVAATIVCVAVAAVVLESPSFRSGALPSFLRPSTLSTFGGRTEAWSASAHLIGRRPLGGFGFGNEQPSIHLYRDDGYRLRNECTAMPVGWVASPLPAACSTLVPPSRLLAHFSGDNAHNSFLGLGVQLGGVVLGLASIALLVGVGRIGTAVRARRALEPALLSAVVAGVGLALVQTYLLDPGNVVTAIFWILLVAGLGATGPERATR